MAIVLQGRDDQAKQSTRYLARGANLAGCSTDLSQYFTNLTAGVSNLLETSPASARFDFSHPRSIGFRITANNTDTGTFVRHGSVSPTRFLFSSANNLRAIVNNVTVGTLPITGLDGTRDDMVVAWTSRANPDTTGASNAVESTLHAWNVTNSTYERLTFTHEASTTKTQTIFFGAADNVSTAIWSGGITAFWWENREQSACEIANDWVSAVTAPTTELVTVHRGFPPTADTLDAANRHQGPAMMWAGDSTRRCVRATLSPMWNEQFMVRPTWTDALLTADDPFIRGAPGAGEWRMHTSWRRLVPAPPTATHVWVRVHVRSWTTSGSAVPIGLRCYSFNRLPGSPLPPEDQGAADPLEAYYVQATIARDDDSSVGEYTVLGLLPIARGRTGQFAGRTVLALALNIDPAAASANDANARIIVRAVHAVPCFYAPDGGLQFGEP